MQSFAIDCCHVQLSLIIFIFHFKRHPCVNLLYNCTAFNQISWLSIKNVGQGELTLQTVVTFFTPTSTAKFLSFVQKFQ